MSLFHFLGFGGLAVLLYIVAGVPSLLAVLMGAALGALTTWLRSGPDGWSLLATAGVFIACIVVGALLASRHGRGPSGVDVGLDVLDVFTD